MITNEYKKKNKNFARFFIPKLNFCKLIFNTLKKISVGGGNEEFKVSPINPVKMAFRVTDIFIYLFRLYYILKHFTASMRKYFIYDTVLWHEHVVFFDEM